MAVALDTALELHPQVAVRPEPFGALAYHYGNRRLIFLKHPDVVSVVNNLAAHDSLQSTLDACGVAPERWPSFVTALSSLESSEIVRERAR
ncbi:MAG: mycofactocin biosynthesis chaperone MftB [Acidimicrobiales bacterium mtb01]|nr:mycofactocin biosynthesis chaperone MftB [Actinomycetota bacterium]TEX46416.1 MAG: mycofactocin biosynthesis chaperone MftB [Acidimicrobiales bacterium mtb01]